MRYITTISNTETKSTRPRRNKQVCLHLHEHELAQLKRMAEAQHMGVVTLIRSTMLGRRMSDPIA
jgi:16S rRNA U516 pseudouridylate synthase RsuA-like enzyme